MHYSYKDVLQNLAKNRESCKFLETNEVSKIVYTRSLAIFTLFAKDLTRD